jgi:hypothetical protein
MDVSLIGIGRSASLHKAPLASKHYPIECNERRSVRNSLSTLTRFAKTHDA